jgi:pimeloyl-ACP methyl ester carboxylesterase
MIKPVVLVYHSFGTYLVSTYFSLFPNNRVIAMIDIGGLPLRFHPELREIVSMMDGPSMT